MRGSITVQAAATFSVSYDGNGNTGGSVPIDNNTYATGATVSVMANTGNLARTGFSFAGWNTAPDGTGTSYVPPAMFTMGSANVTLYAAWTPNPAAPRRRAQVTSQEN